MFQNGKQNASILLPSRPLGICNGLVFVWLFVCLFMCHKMEFYQNGLINWASFSQTGYPLADPASCYNEIWVSLKIKVLPSRTLSQTLNSADFSAFCHCMTIVANVWRTTIASSSQWASTLVYTTTAMTQRVARVRLRQPRLHLWVQGSAKFHA